MRVFTDSLSKTLADDTAHEIVFVRKIIDEELRFFCFSQVGLIAARRTGRLRGGKAAVKDDD